MKRLKKCTSKSYIVALMHTYSITEIQQKHNRPRSCRLVKNLDDWTNRLPRESAEIASIQSVSIHSRNVLHSHFRWCFDSMLARSSTENHSKNQTMQTLFCDRRCDRFKLHCRVLFPARPWVRFSSEGCTCWTSRQSLRFGLEEMLTAFYDTLRYH